MYFKNRNYFAPALVLTTLALFLFAASLLIGPTVSAQKTKQLPPPPPGPKYKPKPTPTPPPPEYEVLKITSNLVMVPVSVTDAEGKPVLGLKPEDFRLEEDGKLQKIAQVGDPEQVPLNIALLVDVSASVVARFDFEQQAAATFLREVLKPDDRATVLAIDETPKMVQRLATASVASQSLMTVKPAKGFTAFFDSVLTASKYLDDSSTSGRRKIVVAISDGDDTARILNVSSAQSRDGDLRLIGVEAQNALNQRGVSETEREVQRSEVTFYSINPSGQSLRLNVRATRAEQGMERIAAATGGAAFVPKDENDLMVIFNRIAAELRSQYLLQYYSNNEPGSRAFRRITVSSSTRPQLRVRAREGYYPKTK